MRSKSVLSIFLSLLLVCGLFAQTDDKSGESGGNLAQQARNPTAALTQFQIVGQYNPSFYHLKDADQLRIVVNPVIPFKTGKLQHIARITLPIVAMGPDMGSLEDVPADGVNPPPNYVPTAEKNGLSDIVAFDFLIFPAPWKGGQIAAGISAIIPTATDPALGTEKWCAGPAIGGLIKSGEFLFGGMVLTNFSYAGKKERADVNAMTIQPFGSQGIGNGWSIELSEMNIGYDFNANRWTNLPFGLRIATLQSLGKLPVRFYFDTERNFANKGVSPEWTFRFAIVPLL